MPEVTKWSKFNKSAPDISEDRLQIIFDNIQRKIDENYFNTSSDLFRNGSEKFMGYVFYPLSHKFLIMYFDSYMIRNFVVRYAKDLESAIKNTSEEFDCDNEFVDIEVIKYPFNY
jgi:hypothetical protein